MADATDKRFVGTECKEFNDEELSFVAYASKEVVDRDGELIKSNAWELEDYLKNPVVLLSHDYSQLPVGKALWVKMGPDGLKFKPKFANTSTGREVYQLYKEGILNAFSVGFIPMEWEDGKGTKARRVYTKAKLLEVSCVAVPSCPDALVERTMSKGFHDKKLQKAFEDIIPQERIDAFVEKAHEKVASPSVEKDALNGQPSIRDIMDAIIKSLVPNGEQSEAWAYVEDMFPQTATTGTCVVEFYGDTGNMRSSLWQYLYQYDTATGIATLSQPVALQEVYVPKSGAQWAVKAGRELSAKNITALRSIATKLSGASEEIGSMLDGKDSVEQEKLVDTAEEKQLDIASDELAGNGESEEKSTELTLDEVKAMMVGGFAEVAKSVRRNQIDHDGIRGLIGDEIKRAMGRLS